MPKAGTAWTTKTVLVPRSWTAIAAPEPLVVGAFTKELAKRTLTNLYNARPSWLANAHDDLDRAVLAERLAAERQ